MGVNRVHVQIKELVLDGFAPADRFQIAEGVRQELAHLIREQGLRHFEGIAARVASVDAGSFPVPPGANAGAIGRRVAQSVKRELTGGRGKR